MSQAKIIKNLRNFIEKTASYFSPTFHELAKELTPYDTQVTKARFGNQQGDGGYVIANEALKNSQVVMSYGIANDITFELDMIQKLGLEVHAFDGGVKTEDFPKYDLLTIHEECVGSDEFLYKQQQSSGKVESFSNQLKNVGAENKKIFIKMDIEGAEYEALKNIPDNVWKNVQGIVIEFHNLQKTNTHKKALELAKILNKFFVLYHVNGCNFSSTMLLFPNKKIPKVMELPYINKDLVKSYKISQEQYPSALDRPNLNTRPILKFRYW